MGDGDSCSSEECKCPFQENVQTGWELLLLSRGKPVFPGWKEAERLQSGCQHPGEQAGVFRAGGRPERGCRLWWQHLCPSLSHGEDTAVTAWVLGFTFHTDVSFLNHKRALFPERDLLAALIFISPPAIGAGAGGAEPHCPHSSLAGDGAEDVSSDKLHFATRFHLLSQSHIQSWIQPLLTRSARHGLGQQMGALCLNFW